jgi:hypothetical protein
MLLQKLQINLKCPFRQQTCIWFGHNTGAARSRVGFLQLAPILSTMNQKVIMKKQVNRVSLGYKKLPVEAIPPFAGWIVTCLTGSAVFINPPIPLVPAVPPNPDAPVDMTTRITALQVAIKNYQDGGMQAMIERNIAEDAVIEGLDALAFYVQTVSRFDRDQMLKSGFVPVSTNRGQSKLETPSVMGIDNGTPTELDVHLSSIANAFGYEVQICTGTGAWTTVKYWAQARTIPLTGLTTGTVYQVRARALGGSTGQSDWSMPGSSIVD